MQPLAIPIYLRRKISTNRHWGLSHAQLTELQMLPSWCEGAEGHWTRGSLRQDRCFTLCKRCRNTEKWCDPIVTMIGTGCSSLYPQASPMLPLSQWALSYEVTMAFSAACLHRLHHERGGRWETKGWQQTRPLHSLYRCLGPWQSQYQLWPTHGGL